MNCARFEMWLDQGRPAADAARAHRHRQECAACTRVAALDARIEAALAVDLGPAPVGLVARIQSRMGPRAPQPGPGRVPWREILAEPAAVPAILCGVVAATAWALREAPGAATAWRRGITPVAHWASVVSASIPVPQDAAARLALAAGTVLMLSVVLWVMAGGLDTALGVWPQGLRRGRSPAPRP